MLNFIVAKKKKFAGVYFREFTPANNFMIFYADFTYGAIRYDALNKKLPYLLCGRSYRSLCLYSVDLKSTLFSLERADSQLH